MAPSPTSRRRAEPEEDLEEREAGDTRQALTKLVEVTASLAETQKRKKEKKIKKKKRQDKENEKKQNEPATIHGSRCPSALHAASKVWLEKSGGGQFASTAQSSRLRHSASQQSQDP